MNFLDKESIRRNIILTRDNLTSMEREKGNKIIINKLLEVFNINKIFDKKIAIYFPFGSEVNIIDICNQTSQLFFLPVVQKDSKILKFFIWNPNKELVVSTKFKKILEPKEQNRNEIPDIIIAPIIAADKFGNRIGNGYGYYDYTINALKTINPKLLYIGICYKEQLIDIIPSTKLDAKLDLLVTN